MQDSLEVRTQNGYEDIETKKPSGPAGGAFLLCAGVRINCLTSAPFQRTSWVLYRLSWATGPVLPHIFRGRSALISSGIVVDSHCEVSQ